MHLDKLSSQWLLWLGLFSIALGLSCSPPPPRFIDRYEHVFTATTGSPYRAIIEYIHDRTTGYSFALAIIHGKEGAQSKLHYDMAKQSFHIDDKTFQGADVKGQLMIWQDGDQRVVQMPDGFTLDEAEQKIVEILDALNTQPAES